MPETSNKMINFDFTFSGVDEIRSFGATVIEEMMQAPTLTDVFGILETGVTNGREIGFIKTDMGLMLESGTIGCDPTQVTFGQLGTSKKVWDLKPVFFRNEECAKDTANTFLQITRKVGMDGYDLTQTEYYALVQVVVAQNLAKSVFIRAWFDDPNIKNIADGGKLKNGISVTKLNAIKGLWLQMAEIYTADPSRRVTITANTLSTTALQLAISDADCTKVFDDLYRKADPRLLESSSLIYLSTRSLATGYRFDMKSKGIDTLMQKQINGETLKLTMVNNVPLIELNIWDTTILAYFNNDTKLDNPHRAILCDKNQLALAFGSTNAFTEFDIFYDRKSKKNIIEGESTMDAKALQDHLFQIAI